MKHFILSEEYSNTQTKEYINKKIIRFVVITFTTLIAGYFSSSFNRPRPCTLSVSV